MARLRDPDGGCPWDLRQDFSSIAPYTIEEAYEVADAISRGDLDDLRAELGDLLLQVAFHARMAEELGHFNFEDVAASISDKLVRRHPHVFEGVKFDTDAERAESWEAAKTAERAAKTKVMDKSLLAGVTLGLPALARAEKLQRRASQGGFDWNSAEPVYAKVAEEIAEVRQAAAENDKSAMYEEIGDLLFAVTNLARHLDVDAEEALRQGNAKFESRFRQVEEALAEQGKQPHECELAEMDALWEQIKRKR